MSLNSLLQPLFRILHRYFWFALIRTAIFGRPGLSILYSSHYTVSGIWLNLRKRVALIWGSSYSEQPFVASLFEKRDLCSTTHLKPRTWPFSQLLQSKDWPMAWYVETSACFVYLICFLLIVKWILIEISCCNLERVLHSN